MTDRLWAKISPEPMSGCWLWMGTINPKGYAAVSWNGAMRRAHKLIWEMKNGPVPEGRQLDHLCRVRSCVNPDHLEAVTGSENTQRGLLGDLKVHPTHCPRGHEYTVENRVPSYRWLRCRECMKRWNVEYRLRRKAKALGIRDNPLVTLPKGEG